MAAAGCECAGAAILAWTIWRDTEHGTWLGAVFILGTGVLVLSLVHESLPHRPGAGAWFGRWGIAILSGAAASGLTFLVAGLGYYLRCAAIRPEPASRRLRWERSRSPACRTRQRSKSG